MVQFNAPTIYQGVPHERVRLEFKDGKVINATSNDTKHLNTVLDTDEGARYVGEFALGVNPYITRPMLDVLFDEKIAGSFHFTPGCGVRGRGRQRQPQFHPLGHGLPADRGGRRRRDMVPTASSSARTACLSRPISNRSTRRT